MLRDPLIRRFISGSLFAAAVVWMAVRFFDHETEVALSEFYMSFVFVGVLIATGLLIAPLMRFFRAKPTMLSSLEDAAASAAASAAAGENASADASPDAKLKASSPPTKEDE